MRIVDDEDNEVSAGEVGELLLKSVTNLRCYLDERYAGSASRRLALYRRSRQSDEEGVITIVDRKKDMIIRGENISALRSAQRCTFILMSSKVWSFRFLMIGLGRMWELVCT